MALEADKRWQLDPFDRAEWEAWLQEQRQAAGAKSGNLYLQARASNEAAGARSRQAGPDHPPHAQVQLNGSVRGSGEGQPPWAKFLDDIPEMDSIRTRFTDGLLR